MDYQDVLAEVGAGSAHPGGMAATYQWLEHFRLNEQTKVLEVGCGTGGTLNHIAAMYHCQCWGIDVRPEMIKKAKSRSSKSGSSASYQVADAADLPFEDGQFDLVYAESVNVFVDDLSKSLAESYRVLKNGGRYIDVEMALMSPASNLWKKEVYRVYGAKRVPDIRGWKESLRSVGFHSVQVLYSQAIDQTHMVSENAIYPETINLSSPGAYQNTEVMRVLAENSQWLEQNYRYMGFAILTGIRNDTMANQS